MITKSQVKDIRALATARGREEQGAFLVEGDKMVREWLHSDSRIRYIIALAQWLDANGQLAASHKEAKIIGVSENDLIRISTQQSPNAALLVAELPERPSRLPVNEWCLVLDQVQDPGNLGAIIRIADWFGISHVVCSPGCADFYNPKVLAAAMGGHLRVQLHITPLPSFLASCKMPVLAATLNGEPLNKLERSSAAALIIGNESKGISPEVLENATRQVTIAKRGGAESLNAAVSAGVLVSALMGD